MSRIINITTNPPMKLIHSLQRCTSKSVKRYIFSEEIYPLVLNKNQRQYASICSNAISTSYQLTLPCAIISKSDELLPNLSSSHQHYLRKQQKHLMTIEKSMLSYSCYSTTSIANENVSTSNIEYHEDYNRLSRIRNVGILAHVDAGKTTVTERMLALTGIVHRAGSVDDGNTVTDYLPAERERGITIQSAAISLVWDWHNNSTSNPKNTELKKDTGNLVDQVKINLIDTPGHVDFSVEVNRSVAVLDGAILVLDAVAGVQAQTETVWKAISTGPATAVSSSSSSKSKSIEHQHEALPCIALINKMDKDGSHFMGAIKSISKKLPGANPLPIQMPLFRLDQFDNDATTSNKESNLPPDIVAIPLDYSNESTSSNNLYSGRATFTGHVDLVHMRAIIYPNIASSQVSDIEQCIPQIINLTTNSNSNCPITQMANEARTDLITQLANYDEKMEEYYLLEEDPTNTEIQLALRRATLQRKVLPVLAGAALRGKGVEPVLDAIADLLPSPLDRLPPALTHQKQKSSKSKESSDEDIIRFGHPYHPTLLALAFKVVHMKNRGGSGDGRVVFARLYSGKLQTKDMLKIITPSSSSGISSTMTLSSSSSLSTNDTSTATDKQDNVENSNNHSNKPRTERVGGMLELSGGRFGNLENNICESGEVCALVGLKTVVTGDTIIHNSTKTTEKKKSHSHKKRNNQANFNMEQTHNIGKIWLAGVASPSPVLTMRIEASSSQDEKRLSEALHLLSIEDPSLYVEETETSTLISGLGELHIEVIIDRLKRDFGLEVTTGSPAVAYRETLLNNIETGGGGLANYDRTLGNTRLQAAVHIIIEPLSSSQDDQELNDGNENNNILTLTEPIVTLGPKVRAYLELDEFLPEDELFHTNELVKSLISGCQGALRRGTIGPYAMANVKCHVVDLDAEGGLSYLNAMPGALRASAANAISSMIASKTGKASCTVIEPTMSVEVTTPAGMVGAVLSDLNTRRGLVGDVIMEDGAKNVEHTKALIQGIVPLVEILGYANSLRSLTGGEGAFTAEYKGHSICEDR